MLSVVSELPVQNQQVIFLERVYTLLKQRGDDAELQIWLGRLQRELGNPDDTIDWSIENLDTPVPLRRWKSFTIRKEIVKALNFIIAQREKTITTPVVHTHKESKFRVWNPAVGEKIENGLPDTAEDFDGLYAWLAESKIFDIPQTHGFYATAPGTSDTMMGSGVWVTDNLRMLRADLLVLEKLVHGTSSYYQLRSRIDTLMANLSHYYQSHIVREKITAIFGDSAYYGQHISHGLPHIFRLSETDAVDGTPQFEPHGDWANHLRLESHATALLSFVRYQKLLPPPPNTTTIAKTIDDLVRFLVQIDFPQVLSSSAWEDAPFREVFADTALAARALEEALESWYIGDTELQTKTIMQIERAKSLLRERIGSKMSHPDKSADAGSIFGVTDCPRLYEDVGIDIEAKFDFLLAHEQRLTRDHGMVRYADAVMTAPEHGTDHPHNTRVAIWDSYLPPNFSIAIDPVTGRLDFSNRQRRQSPDPERPMNGESAAGLINRNQYAVPGQEAEWFMDSDLSIAYMTLLQDYDTNGVEKPEFRHALIERIQMTLLRALWRITPTGERILKANGEYIHLTHPTVPEAIQYVFFDGEYTPMIGNSHALSWAAKSLQEALLLYQKLFFGSVSGEIHGGREINGNN